MSLDPARPGAYRQLFDLTGRVAVVTGGAGLLGQRFCAGLADFGARVAVVDVSQDPASALAAKLTSTFGAPCIGVGCDVTDPASVDQMVARVEAELGSVDILHNNAATKGRDLARFYAPLEAYDVEAWREVMSVNLDGLFTVAQTIGRRMASRGKGSIIQTASIYGVVGPDQRIYQDSEFMGHTINTPPVYSASKAGVIGLTRHLATYWAPRGVRVNTLTPGGVQSGQNSAFTSRYSSRVPMERMARPDEVVSALIFLASDASSYVTGQNIIVDGGLSAW